MFAGTVDLTRLDEAAIANLGIGRKFQKPTVFDFHTIEDNILLALKSRRTVSRTLFWKTEPDQQKRIDDILGIVKLADRRDRLAGSLSHGQKQWLEIGMLLAQDPKLLLVDEPAAGMTDGETAQTAVLLHDMGFIRELGVKVTVLHEGSVLAEGPLDQVSANERVVEVYLGR